MKAVPNSTVQDIKRVLSVLIRYAECDRTPRIENAIRIAKKTIKKLENVKDL